MPGWQRRIKEDIKRIRKYITKPERIKRGGLRKRGKIEQLEKQKKKEEGDNYGHGGVTT